MNLIWKLLRQHVSPAQFAGFFFANLLGMWIVMLGVQFYIDVAPVLTADDAFINQNYIVVSKRITTAGSLAGRSNTFSAADCEELSAQDFCRQAAPFVSSQYKVSAAMSMNGASPLRTDLFFEAVPDNFVDIDPAAWHYEEGSEEVPVILPRTYIALYNFGFAQSRGLPKVSDGLVGMIDMQVFINSSQGEGRFRGRILGFSNRLNTILVPQGFMDWSNAHFEPGKTEQPSRLIAEVKNPADAAIATFMQSHGYEVEDNKLEAGKATYFLRVVVSIVMLIGLLVSLLSFYILMLSIYLLVQKNTRKLENLLLIGYSPSRVSRPYQLLALGMNVAVLVFAVVLLVLCRSYYMDVLTLLFPQMSDGGIALALCVGAGICIVVSLLNGFAIRRKVMNIWWRKVSIS
ncbi:MAG: ABC transporter permease [Alloprevotella sp.]|nr:ABC transporter permease [Alloprevotella sp.]